MMSRRHIVGSLLICSILYLCLYCTSTYCTTLKPNDCVKPYWFKCHNDQCVPMGFRCDGDPDCRDESDEQNCTGFKYSDFRHVPRCKSDEFMCDNNECILSAKFCDLIEDCADGSDESPNCTERLTCEGKFRCHEGHCIKQKWRCDGVVDCPDASDEVDCDNVTISVDDCKLEKNLYLCPNKRCIPLHKTCNGKDDCGDGQDENGLCSNGTALCRSANCDQKCRKTPQGAVCVCNPGYELSNHTCIDINECESYGICDQMCTNIKGSYYCHCGKNYVILDDKRTCKAENGEAILIFASTTEIRGIYLDSQIYFPLIRHVNRSTSVTIDKDYVYWSQGSIGNQKIVRTSMSKDEKEEGVVVLGLHTVSGIALDWITSNIYFTDSIDEHIGVCNNLFCMVLIKEKHSYPKDITLVANEGMMFWCTWGTNTHIAEAGMNGQDKRLLVTDNLGWPDSVSVDSPNGRLYWVDTKTRQVESIRLDGTDRRVILQNTIHNPRAIEIFENKLYWTDWGRNTIEYCDKFTGKNWTTLLQSGSTPLNIHIDHSAIKPKVSNPCESSPKCSELCLLKQHGGYTCACSLNKKLNADNHTCQDHRIDYVIAFAGKTIAEFYNDMIGTPIVHFDTQWRSITAMTYNVLTGHVLMSDEFINQIISYNPVTKQFLFPYKDISLKGVVTGMAHDYIGDNLYISFGMEQTIEVVNLKNFNKTIFIFNDRPHDITLVPERGMMFVIFKEKYQQVYYLDRMGMDARSYDPPSMRQTLNKYTSHRDSMAPRLCYDSQTKVVFFVDHINGVLQKISLNDLKVLTQNFILEKISNLVCAGEYLYWNEVKTGILFWRHKTGMLSATKYFDLRHYSFNKKDEISHLVAIHNVSIEPYTYGCQNNNGRCSHVCLTISTTSFVCACPPEMKLAPNNRTCIAAFTCPTHTFPCNDNSTCIDQSKWCDGIIDCPSSEDESVDCEPSNPCGKGHFTCLDGKCINSHERCNWVYDCVDMSDEDNCVSPKICTSNEFSCDRQCINIVLVCNGEYDCLDFSDEINCDNHTCPLTDFFLCKETKQCIPAEWKCDGERDCKDASDENDCEEFNICSRENFLCKNDFCISLSLLCNGINDCGDNSDEEDCWIGRKSLTGDCNNDEYPCANTNICISKDLRCNGVQNCPKNDDEHHCTSCLPDEFLCKNHKCIPRTWMCDEIDDCGDKSDEQYCDGQNIQIDINMLNVSKCVEFQCSSNGKCLSYSKTCNSIQDCPDGSDERGKCMIACEWDNVCDEFCFKTPQGGVCGCNTGYRLDSDGKTCIDINECENVSCSQLCENTKGSYKCSCFNGYILRADGVSCKAMGPPMKIFTAIDNDIREISLNLHTVNVLNVSSNVDITGIDVNMFTDFIYWSNGELGTISRMNLETRNVSTFMDTSYPTKLAVDWITGNVYFIDKFHPNAIKICDMEKMKYATLIQEEDNMQLNSLVIDPINRWMYWSAVDRKIYKNGQIFRAYLKGTNKETIISENVGNVNGLAIDHMHCRLYWADSINKVIESSNFDGTKRRKFMKTNEYPLDIEIFENTIYLLTNTRNRIIKCPLYGKQNCEMMDVGRNNIYKHFVIEHISRYSRVTNFCKQKQCDHICVLDVNEAVCICEDGKLITSNDICVTVNENLSRRRLVSKKTRENQRSGYSSIIIILLIILLLMSSVGYCYYHRKKFWPNTTNPLSVRFHNPAYDRADEVAVILDQSNSSLSPGEHEYMNPVDDELLTIAEKCSIERLRQNTKQLEEEQGTSKYFDSKLLLVEDSE